MKIPRAENNTSKEIIAERVSMLRSMGIALPHITHYSFEPESASRNIENFIGVAQIPIGLAGPLKINGEHAQGEFLVPLATTEGVLVASYSRGMKAITEADGCYTHIRSDFLTGGAIFPLSSLALAVNFSRWCEKHTDDIAKQVEATTQHGRLHRLTTDILGHRVAVNFQIATVDAMGSNMRTSAVEAACQWISREAPDTDPGHFYIVAEEKKPINSHRMSGKGRNVVAEVVIPESLLNRTFHTRAADLIEYFECMQQWWTTFGAQGHNGMIANGLAALYIACGQDPAYIGEACSGHLNMSLEKHGDIRITLDIPCLIIGTVGGACGLPTQRECLRIIGCEGEGGARKFAEIAAAVALAGELSGMAAVSAHEMASAHERMARHR